MKTFSEFMNEEFSQGMKDWLKDNETTRKMKAREPTEPSKFPPSDPNWAEKMHSKFDAIANRRDAPRTVKPEPVDFTGSRHSDGKTVSVRDQITVTPDKPLVGKSDSIGKLLAAKGYDRSGKKIVKPTAQTRVATRPETPEVPVKKTQTAVPIPKARPSNLKPAKPVQTFKQAFANAPEGSKFNWTDPKTGKTGTYLRKTKKTRR